jgi:hypothetical protein
MPIDQADVEAEILAGLPNEKDRLEEAWHNERYASACFEEYDVRPGDGGDVDASDEPVEPRTTPIFQRVRNVLTSHLYKAQPVRKLADERATDVLGRIYRSAKIAPKWHRADQLCLTNGFSAFRWYGTGDPLNPVKAQLWGGHELVTWLDPDDPTQVGAVATIDCHDSRRRLRLYTPDEVVTYETEKGVDHVAFGSTSYAERSRQDAPRLAMDGFEESNRVPNRYRDADGRGFLPFSFQHWDFPAQTFSTTSPGDGLRSLNASINQQLTSLGDSMEYVVKPLIQAVGANSKWKPPRRWRPGEVVVIPGPDSVNGGTGPTPTLAFLMPDVAYVAAHWADLNNHLDHVLEMNGVPPVLVRMIQAGARSGASITAEQTPLMGWVEGRRTAWSCYEEEAARTALMVYATHVRRSPDLPAVRAALRAWSFTIHWPSLWVTAPGPARDQSDDWRLARGLVSKLGILMERQDLNEAEALAALVKVRDQNRKLQALGIDVASPAKPATPPPPAAGPDAGDDEQPPTTPDPTPAGDGAEDPAADAAA